MAQELGIAVDWRPFVLDIPSYLGSATLDKSGEVAKQKRSNEQWSGVKYAYYDCRRYANLRGLTVRGTVKIWDTNLASIAMLWARAQGDDVLARYIDAVYEPFWKRELDVENPEVIRSVLADSGADIAGFDRYTQGEGAAQNEALQNAAFEAGIFGVPTYIVKDNKYFGREHLPRIRWHLSGEPGAAPDIGYLLPEGLGKAAAPGAELELCIDFKCPHSYLALAPTLKLAAESGRKIIWHPRLSRPSRPAPAPEELSRGARHRILRAENAALELTRYAEQPLLDKHPGTDSRIAAMGLLWLAEVAPLLLDRYVKMVFEHYWQSGEPIDGINTIKGFVDKLGVDSEPLEGYVKGAGPAALIASQEALSARGVIATPTYLLGEERFIGRQHLPLLACRLGAQRTSE
jgi:2-hydroxychromene-2-carboxylate isomerase